MKRVLLLLVPLATFAAPPSEVADALMQGDTAGRGN